MDLSQSGNTSHPLVISSYGLATDSLPIISGAIAVSTEWTLDNSVYSTPFTSPTNSVFRLFMNDAPMVYARSPNKPFYYYSDSVGTDTITDPNRTESNGYWTGATLRARMNHWAVRTYTVEAFQAGTFTLDNDLYFPVAGFGYFLEGKGLGLLDAEKEWYWDKAGGRLYFKTPGGVNPNNKKIEVVVYTNGLKISTDVSFVNVSMIRFEKHSGSNVAAPEDGNYNIVISDCETKYSGKTGIQFANAINSLALRNHVSFADISGIDLGTGSRNSTADSNIVTDISLEMGYNANSAGIGAGQYSDGLRIINNYVNNTGYVGIHYGGPNVFVDKNYVENACQTLDDCGGLYGWGDFTTKSTISNNIVKGVGLNGAAREATPDDFGPYSFCIYIDDNCNNLVVNNNTASNCLSGGMYFHNTVNITARANSILVIPSSKGFIFTKDFTIMKGVVLSGNKVFSTAQDSSLLSSNIDLVAGVATFSGNYWCHLQRAGIFDIEGGSLTKSDWTSRYESSANFCNWNGKQFNVTEYLSANLVENPNFQDDADDWYYWPDNCNLTRLQNAENCNGVCAKFAIDSSEDVSAYFGSRLQITEDMYELLFTAHSSTPGRTVWPEIRYFGVPYSWVTEGISDTWDVTPRNFVLYYQRTLPVDSAEKILAFHTDSIVGGSIYVSNVSLRAVRVQEQHPIKVFSNPTRKSEWISLPNGEQFRDFNGKLVYNQVMLGAFQSVVLLDEGYNSSLLLPTTSGSLGTCSSEEDCPFNAVCEEQNCFCKDGYVAEGGACDAESASSHLLAGSFLFYLLVTLV
eukprot:TRINITY_DN6344_c0_g3_i1.p1 TRINITY_DN6344_c0_g3~~TRINITY_DN6344_c0_g3_i1.p1  ORF type:complete len:887 (+),score=123.73 TRINITY_DN6344_c0_g3_i1:261-2663(+)